MNGTFPTYTFSCICSKKCTLSLTFFLDKKKTNPFSYIFCQWHIRGTCDSQVFKAFVICSPSFDSLSRDTEAREAKYGPAYRCAQLWNTVDFRHHRDIATYIIIYKSNKITSSRDEYKTIYATKWMIFHKELSLVAPSVRCSKIITDPRLKRKGVSGPGAYVTWQCLMGTGLKVGQKALGDLRLSPITTALHMWNLHWTHVWIFAANIQQSKEYLKGLKRFRLKGMVSDHRNIGPLL